MDSCKLWARACLPFSCCFQSDSTSAAPLLAVPTLATTYFGHDLLWPRSHRLATFNFGHFRGGGGEGQGEGMGRGPRGGRGGEIVGGPNTRKGWGPETVGAQTQSGGPKGGGSKGGRPKISRFFSFSRPIFFFFFSFWVSSRVFFPLSGGLLVEFWWCFGRSGPQMCLFSASERSGGGRSGGWGVRWPKSAWRTKIGLARPKSAQFGQVKGCGQSLPGRGQSRPGKRRSWPK